MSNKFSTSLKLFNKQRDELKKIKQSVALTSMSEVYHDAPHKSGFKDTQIWFRFSSNYQSML